MHSLKAKGQSKGIISCHYGNSCLNTDSIRRRVVFAKEESTQTSASLYAILDVGAQKSTFWWQIIIIIIFSFSPPTSNVGWVEENFPLLAKPPVGSWVKDINVRFIFPLPCSSGLFVAGLVKCFPLTNLLFQTIFNSKKKRDSESHVLVTTTCIACTSVINYSCGISKI